MLSILIPTYNYPIKHLISSLEKTLKFVDFNYEILCQEDGSQLHIEDNKTACSSQKNTTHIISKTNNGRITSRKLLAKQAKYNWLLFLDADVIPKDNDFIIKYSSFLNTTYEAVYGGYSYNLNRPKNDYILRWKYGRTCEEVNANSRNERPYKIVVSGNFLIKKETFLAINSEINSDGYGYDNFFGAVMKSKGIKILHIDNNVIHNGLDKNEIFLIKVEKAVETIFKFHIRNKSIKTENNLLELYKTLKRFGLSAVIASLFKLGKPRLKKQLLSSNPNIKLLQFYKLGYLCSLS